MHQKLNRFKRPAQLMILVDGAEKTASPLEYHSNFYGIDASLGRPRMGSCHLNMTGMNALYADGHVNAKKWSDVREEDVSNN
ncbi:hypothetical protein SDC9_149427 [bioreactor metagenome]|uniref:Uncharacterized protein n=1 Tax=bioreactor metagenome TaxID=1076179 RepID=A0A645ENU1_9ZZZZ